MSSSSMESHLVLLRLQPIKDALRPNEWEMHREKVLAAVHQMISETISSDDAYTIHGDETCMIAFAKTTMDVARATANGIGDKIVRDLFGDFGANNFPLQAQVLAIRDILPGPDPDNPDSLAQDPYPSGVRADTPNEKRDEIRKEAQKQARRRKLLELFEPEHPAEIMHQYRPVWRADDQRIDRFRYASYLQSSPEERLVGYAVLGPSYSETDLLDLDIQATENAIIDLKHAVDAGHDVGLSLPIHFETVGSNHGRSELIKILPILPASFRQRITFTIEGIPEGIPEGRLREVVSVLKPFSESRSIMIDPLPANGRVLKTMIAKVRAVGMDTICMRLPVDASHSDVKTICSIVPQINSVGLKAWALRVTCRDEVAELVTAGCSTLAGPIFGGPFEELPKPLSVPLGEIMHPTRKLKLPHFFRG